MRDGLEQRREQAVDIGPVGEDFPFARQRRLLGVQQGTFGGGGLAFQDTALVWQDTLHLRRFDRHEEGEKRCTRSASPAAWSCWLSGTTVRLIGARKVTLRERTAYEHDTDA